MRNKSEQGPRRPGEMGDEAIVACIASITAGQTFRVWYHVESLYKGGPRGGFHINEVYLTSDEIKAMLAGKGLEFKCTHADGFTASTVGNTFFSVDHAPLFRAIEVL